MKKEKIIVPKGIRYLSEWNDFNLPDHPSIIDKQITGCGFTEFCLTNPSNVILVSPRKILLENKEEQHKGEVFYATTGLEKQVDFEKDLTATPKGISIKKQDFSEEEKQMIMDKINALKEGIRNFYMISLYHNKPCKILVTYDSFRHVKEALADMIDQFYVVVDEFQSIFTDSKFKSDTEIEFLQHIQDLQKVTYVSATPMIDKYLEMLDEFKDLPFYELDWESKDPLRILRPKLQIHSCSRSILPSANKIIQSYLNGEFESTIIDIDGEKKEVVSKEAVLYVNSVKNICDIISRNGLTLENTNVRTSDNEDKVRKAFNLKKQDLKVKGIESVIGKVPLEGEPHKMFTLCTRTVYLGADFYSECARTFIFSDANIDSLSVDITLDLPQILGRQRLETNPWKSRADLYYKTINEENKLTEEELNEIIERKIKNTNNLLGAYQTCVDTGKHTLAETYQKVAKSFNYRDDYVAVNEHVGNDLQPVFNNLMKVSDLRCYEIQQVDYADRFRVFNKVGEHVDDFDSFMHILNEIEYGLTTFTERMRFIYSLDVSQELMKLLLDNLTESSYSKYYYSISKERAGTLGYVRGNLEKEYTSLRLYSSNINSMIDSIKNKFKVGEKYSKSNIKETLKNIYEECGYSKTAKANDLDNYFEIKTCKILNISTGKWDHGFKIVSLKEEGGTKQ